MILNAPIPYVHPKKDTIPEYPMNIGGKEGDYAKAWAVGVKVKCRLCGYTTTVATYTPVKGKPPVGYDLTVTALQAAYDGVVPVPCPSPAPGVWEANLTPKEVK